MDFSSAGCGQPGTDYVRAAQYVRMSTDRQKYSIHNQAEALQQYAVAHGMLIVRTYADEGISGLTIRERPALAELISDIEQGRANFEVLLIYDVSRWGRFQDTDESAYYEYLCRKAGVRIVYCAERFDNDQSPMASILKSIKRVMAAEYSRELSARVVRAQMNLAKRGYRQGGEAVLGLRRMVVDANGRPLRRLKRGQRKGLSEERVITVPGPPKEVARVHQIFEMFVAGRSLTSIADQFNQERVPRSRGGKWYSWEVRKLLENELYVGNYVYGMTQQRLKSPVQRTDPKTWVRAEGVSAPIVSQELFDRAKEMLAQKRQRWAVGRDVDVQEMMDELRAIVARDGELRGSVFDQGDLTHTARTYTRYLGGRVAIRQALGLPINQDYAFLANQHEKAAIRASLITQLTEHLTAQGRVVRSGGRWVLEVGGGVTLSVHVLMRTKRQQGQWHLRTDEIRIGDFALIALLERDQTELKKLLFIPRAALAGRSWMISGDRFDHYAIANVEALSPEQWRASNRSFDKTAGAAHRLHRSH